MGPVYEKQDKKAVFSAMGDVAMRGRYMKNRIKKQYVTEIVVSLS